MHRPYDDPRELDVPFTIDSHNNFTRGLGHQGWTLKVEWIADTAFYADWCPSCDFPLSRVKLHHCNFAEPAADEVECLGCGLDLMEYENRNSECGVCGDPCHPDEGVCDEHFPRDDPYGSPSLEVRYR